MMVMALIGMITMSWLVTSSQRASSRTIPCSAWFTQSSWQQKWESVHTDWCIHLALSWNRSLYSHIQIFSMSLCTEETFSFVLLTLYLNYSPEWKEFVTSCRISGDLAARSKSRTLFKWIAVRKTLVPRLLFPLYLPFFICIWLEVSLFTGLGEKGLHEQALRHPGRVHQCAECSGWSCLLWRTDKKVSCEPALQAQCVVHFDTFVLSIS